MYSNYIKSSYNSIIQWPLEKIKNEQNIWTDTSQKKYTNGLISTCIDAQHIPHQGNASYPSEIKLSAGKQKLRKFIITKFASQEMLKEIL